MNTRQTILVSVAILLVGAVAVWWYLGFSLGFMRFFASEPLTREGPGDGSPTTSPSRIVRASPPPGCYYQDVQCLDNSTTGIRAPCDPVLVCPSCVPLPSCVNDNPPCAPDLLPGTVFCPVGGIVSCAPSTQTVNVGGSANLSAQGGNGTYQWYAPEGGTVGGVLIGANGVRASGFSVVYNVAGTKKVTVQSARGDGSNNVDLVACEVVVVPAGI